MAVLRGKLGNAYVGKGSQKWKTLKSIIVPVSIRQSYITVTKNHYLKDYFILLHIKDLYN
jgi:hypothetical protein